jgi:hypothetical protein
MTMSHYLKTASSLQDLKYSRTETFCLAHHYLQHYLMLSLAIHLAWTCSIVDLQLFLAAEMPSSKTPARQADGVLHSYVSHHPDYVPNQIVF